MNLFWDPILRRLLEATHAQSIVEVGVDSGLLTEKVLDYCAASGAVLHAIDPQPQIDVGEWQRRHRERLVFHRALSLDILGEIDDVDVVLIDGDHNWYTVFHELMLIEQTMIKNDRIPPPIALHDVDWPYGRRDMYYDPDTVPEADRQPYCRLGLVPGEAEPVAGGINEGLANGIVEHSPHNGVRTAIEDFTAASQFEWRVVYAPGHHGLAIAAVTDRLDANEELRATLDSVGTAEFLETRARELEVARISFAIEANRTLSDSLVGAERRLAEIPDLQLQVAKVESELSEARGDAVRAREEAAALDQRVTRGQQVLTDVFNSPSWRLTRPLRTAKHSASRLRDGLGRLTNASQRHSRRRPT